MKCADTPTGVVYRIPAQRGADADGHAAVGPAGSLSGACLDSASWLLLRKEASKDITRAVAESTGAERIPLCLRQDGQFRLGLLAVHQSDVQNDHPVEINPVGPAGQTRIRGAFDCNFGSSPGSEERGCGQDRRHLKSDYLIRNVRGPVLRIGSGAGRNPGRASRPPDKARSQAEW